MGNEIQNTVDIQSAHNLLRDGCYYIRFTPIEAPDEVLFYEGTLRVKHIAADEEKSLKADIKAGGDLYCRWCNLPFGRDPKHQGIDKNNDPKKYPDLNDGIPIFPRTDYKYYLEVIKLLEATETSAKADAMGASACKLPNDRGFTARFKVHEYDRKSRWPNPGTRIALMKGDNSSRRQPAFQGKVMDEDSGQVIGTLTMMHVSDYLRKAHILVDLLAPLKSPCTESKWIEVFQNAGWEVKVTERTTKPTGSTTKELWTVADLHCAMLKLKDEFERDKTNKVVVLSFDLQTKAETTCILASESSPFDYLDKEWLYHLFCVPRIKDFDRGVMYDTYGTDSNNIPREGAAIASRWKFDEVVNAENEKYPWGAAKGELQNTEVIQRVAIHEIGHAMGLEHNHQDRGFMNTTDAIAEEGTKEYKKLQKEVDDAVREVEQQDLNALVAKTAGKKDLLDSIMKRKDSAIKEKNAKQTLTADARFPKNIVEAFHLDDLYRLQFGADVTVRPGGEFDDSGPYFDRQVKNVEGANLDVSPLLVAVPLGAPVRVDFSFRNVSEEEQAIPGDLSLASGVISGSVTDPTGITRSFWPLKKCIDNHFLATLKPKEAAHSSVTLLRGSQGALFPMAGTYRIRINAAWEDAGSAVSLSGTTEVQITPAVDDSHRVAAMKLLSTPDTLLAFAIGREYLVEGSEAVDIALANEVLRPHFLSIPIKEDALKKGKEPNRSLFDADSVLSLSEIIRIVTLLRESNEGKLPDIQQEDKEKFRKKVWKLGASKLSKEAFAVFDPWNSI
ncbi:MAG TPA: matrixin family metalloprotease [Candidatus Kapabacteria bacterium]|nr:matrixin family metalloprotease [Candidatus Kapabacteria bacterium]